jgi:hypothetical protein
MRTFVATAAAIVAFAITPTAAMAHSYTGNWPVTVSHSQRGNGTFLKLRQWCLRLTPQRAGHAGQRRRNAFRHIPGHQRAPRGDDRQPGETNLGGLVFVGRASNGHIGTGTYDQVYDREDFVSGVAVFGAKGGRSIGQ